MTKIKLLSLSLVVFSSFALSAQASSEREFRFSHEDRNERMASSKVAQSNVEQNIPSVESCLNQEKSSCVGMDKPCGECC